MINFELNSKESPNGRSRWINGLSNHVQKAFAGTANCNQNMLKINFKFYFVNFHFDPVAYIPWSIYASCIRLRLDEM